MRINNLIKQIHSNDRNLTGAIEEVIIYTVSTEFRKKWSPCRKLPAMKLVKIKFSHLDKLCAFSGINKRVNNATLIMTKYRNRDLNRFIEHQRIIMINAKTEETFWKIVSHLLKRSNVWFLLTLKRIYPYW